MTSLPFGNVTSLPFGPDTVTWRVDLEPVVVLGGGRALLMQVAHPLVAAGVQQHSDYERDPYGRLFGTLDVMSKLVFGSPAVSQRQTSLLAATHRRVIGEADDGTPYSACDPALLLWVWATLVDTALTMYEAVFGRLAPGDRARFYAEQHLVADGCGVPEACIPDTLADFERYVSSTVVGTLTVTDAARAVAANVLDPPLPWYLAPARPPSRLVTVGLLPDSLRTGYRLSWSRRQQLALHALLRGLRATMPLVPRSQRERPLLAMAGPSPVRPPAFLRPS